MTEPKSTPDFDLEQLIGQLAQQDLSAPDGRIGGAEDSTLRKLKAELDTVAAELREPPPFDEYENESDCHRAAELVKEIGREPSFSTQEAIEAGNEERIDLGQIGPYQFVEKLGEGGMGAVYKALHTKLKRVVAIKVLPAERMKDPQAIARFEREMEAVGALHHPNIVAAHDAGDAEGMHYLVMEYVEGIDLSTLARRVGPLEVADACEITRQAAIGLQEAHQHKMVHRDIKPSNLMVTTTGDVKILDLGLALLPERFDEGEELTNTGQAMGTLDYMAPEQGGSSHDVDIRADIYALGATLYKMLTAQAIYAGPNYKTIMDKWRALATEDAAPIQSRRPEISDELGDVIHRMLARKANDRYATPQAVAEALAPFCGGADLAALAQRQPSTTEKELSNSTTSLMKEAGSLDTSHVSTGCQPVPEACTTLATPLVSKAKPQAAARRKSPATWLLVGAGLLGILVLAAAMVFYFQTPSGTLRLEIHDPDIEVRVKGEDIVLTDADKEPIKLKAGEHTLIVTRGDDFTFETKQLILKKGETTTVKVELLPGKVHVVSAGTTIGSHALAGKTNSSKSAAESHAPPLAVAPFDADQAKRHQQAWADYLGVPVEKDIVVGKDGEGVKLTMVLIPPGEFIMGSPKEEQASFLVEAKGDHWAKKRIPCEGPQHRVRISKPFYLGKHEVTRTQWQTLIGDNPPQFKDRWSCPADEVAWNDIQPFLAKLNESASTDKMRFVLPTEAQWEYACRAGTTTAFSFGDNEADLPKFGWFKENSDRQTHPVGSLKANAFGLYDMHGNVREWCRDWYAGDYYFKSPKDDPTGPSNGTERVYRGGCWLHRMGLCRSAHRNSDAPDYRSRTLGFRLAASIELPKQPAELATPKPNKRPDDAPPRAIAPFDAGQAKQHQQAWADYLGVPVEKEIVVGKDTDGKDVSLTMVLIPPGEFMMGSPAEEQAQLLAEAQEDEARWAISRISSEGPQHRVRITKPFYLGKHEVTQAQWQTMMGENPSKFKDEPSHPVEQVSWDDIQLLLERLNGTASAEELVFVLPTEAQCEYACRAGTTTLWHSGDSDDNLRQYGWFQGNSGGKTHPVGGLKANYFGLHDMHGNVWEWCADWYATDYYGNALVNDPRGPAAGDARVHRGGGWRTVEPSCRSAYRHHDASDIGNCYIGFRLAASIETVKQAPPLAVAPFNADEAKQHQQAWADYLGVPVEKEIVVGKDGDGKDVSLTMVLIPPGEFMMGSTDDEQARFLEAARAVSEGARIGDTPAKWVLEKIPTEGPQHRVRITQPFYLGKYEVTQTQWQSVMGDNPSRFSDSPSRPVEMIGWDESQSFVEKLNSGHGRGEMTFALPREAQWEYACRAGTTSPYFFDDEDDLPEYAWVESNAESKTHPVGQLQANAFGLHDMLGNVQEWCGDMFAGDYYENSPLVDPPGPSTENANPAALRRVSRGGSWSEHASTSRSAFRIAFIRTQGHRNDHLGFRLAASIAVVRRAPSLAVAPFDTEEAKQHQQAWAEKLGMEVDYTNEIGMKFRLIPPGKFKMGSGQGDPNEQPIHDVTLSKPFYIGMYEVLQEEYEAVVPDNPSKFEGERLPVEFVTSEEAAAYCDALSKKTGQTYRLPTEAEWEFACRAGTDTPWSFGDDPDDLPDYARCKENGEGKTHPVGQKKPNAFGPFDMHGNVFEYCSDFTAGYSEEAKVDPQGPKFGRYRGFRGGSWFFPLYHSRSANRQDKQWPARGTHVGFRVVLEIDNNAN